MNEIIKICVITEYNTTMYVECKTAKEILNVINSLDFIIDVIKYEDYYFKEKIEKCDYVLNEFIY